MLGPSTLLFLALQVLNVYTAAVNARPTVALALRQNGDNLSQPVTVQTQDVVQTYVFYPQTTPVEAVNKIYEGRLDLCYRHVTLQ